MATSTKLHRRSVLAAAAILLSSTALGCVAAPDDDPSDSTSEASTRIQKRVLVVVSSATDLPIRDARTGAPKTFASGYFLNELGAVLRELDEAGYAVDIATPGGVAPTIDENSFDLLNFYALQSAVGALHGELARPGVRRDLDIETAWKHFGPLQMRHNAVSDEVRAFVKRTEDEQAKRVAAGTLKPKKLLALEAVANDGALARYLGVYVPGGHAPKVDLLFSKAMRKVLWHFHAQKDRKVTSLICHAPIVLLSAFYPPGDERTWRPEDVGKLAQADKDRFIYRGYDIAIGNREEEWALENFAYLKGVGRLTFYVEPAARDAGLRPNPTLLRRPISTPQVHEHEEVITGANPASVDPLARRLVERLNQKWAASQR